MIMKAARNDVVCKVGQNLLVKFKDQKEGRHPVNQAKLSDFERNETDVRLLLGLNV